jgi:hypothetical protein
MSDRNNYEYGKEDYDGAEDGGEKNNGAADENLTNTSTTLVTSVIYLPTM